MWFTFQFLSGICLPGTELLQSPFRTEFTMGSRSHRYRRSLWHHRRFLRSYRRSLWHCRDPCSDQRPRADAATPIVARLAKHHKPLLNIVKHHETNVKHCDTSWTTGKTSWNTLKTLRNIMKHSWFDATISALDAETSALDAETSALDAETSALDVQMSAFGAAASAIARRSFDAMISALDAETALDAESWALGTATSAIARSYRHGVSGNIIDCGVGITPQMCNRVTNHRDMSTFSKPVSVQTLSRLYNIRAFSIYCHLN